MDINFEKDNIVFNYRIAIIIRHNNKILVQKDIRTSHYTLPGGRNKLEESSIECAIREFKEETNIDTTYVKSIGLIENFFTSSFNNKKYHELLIIHELKFNNTNLYNSSISNVEDKNKDSLHYLWFTKEDLKKLDFKPKIVLDIIDSNTFQHLINID